jgi:hypothetical protein
MRDRRAKPARRDIWNARFMDCNIVGTRGVDGPAAFCQEREPGWSDFKFMHSRGQIQCSLFVTRHTTLTGRRSAFKKTGLLIPQDVFFTVDIRPCSLESGSSPRFFHRAMSCPESASSLNQNKAEDRPASIQRCSRMRFQPGAGPEIAPLH